MRQRARVYAFFALATAAVACSPAPRPVVRVAPPPPPPRRVEAPPPPASSPPPPAAPEQPNVAEPGCALAPATTTVAHEAIGASGLTSYATASRAAFAWTASGANGLEPRGIEIDSNGLATSTLAVPAPLNRTLSIEHVAPYLATDGSFRVAADRRVRIDASEWIDCGAVRGEVAHFEEGDHYADEGDVIHFDPAACSTVVADAHPFVVWTYPEPDNDLFSGSVSVYAGPHPQAGVRQWTFRPTRALFDLGIPWLRALAMEAPVDYVATAAPGGGYAIAWRQNGVVAMQWLRDDLAPRVAPRNLSGARAEAGPPQLASNGREVVAVYAERANARAHFALRAVRLVPNSNRRTPVSSPVALTRGTTDAFAPAIVSVGEDAWAITWSERAGQSPDRVVLQLFDASLGAIGSPVVVAESASMSRVAPVGENLVVAALSGDAATRDVVTRAARCIGRDAFATRTHHE